MAEVNPLFQPEPVDHLDVYKYVRTMLGGAITEVEIDDDGLQILLLESLEEYSRLIPKIRWFSTPAYAGVQEYRLPRDTIGFGLVDVMIPRIDPIAPLMLSSGPRLDIFGYRYSYPYRDISELYIDYTYFMEAQRILSSGFDWDFKNGALYITPKPDEPFTLTYASAFPRDLRSIPADDIDWVKKMTLAQVEVAVGRTRRKFHLPGTQTDQQLDGQQLVDEGERRMERMHEDLYLRTPPLPIYRS